MQNTDLSESKMIKVKTTETEDELSVSIEEVTQSQTNNSKIKFQDPINKQKYVQILGIFGLLFIFVTLSVVIIYNYLKEAWPNRLRLVLFENVISEFPDLKNQLKAERLIKFVEDRSCYYSNVSPYRFAILNNKIFIYGNAVQFSPARTRILNDTFNRILQKNQIPDAYFIIFQFDYIPQDQNKTKRDRCSKMPMFIFNKNVQSFLEKNKFLFPDDYILDNWQASIDEVKNASMQYQWDQKIPKLFFVGAPSGRGPLIKNDTDFAKYYHRGALVQMSLQNPDIIYARINGNYTVDLAKQLFRRSGFNQQIFLPRISMAEHIKYKYLISVDGEGSAWKRPCSILFSNSVLFKTYSKNIQWFYDKLVHGQNYIKIKEDLSNLFSERERLQQDPVEAIKITKKANEFSQKFLTPEAIDNFIADTIKKYAKIQELSLTEEEKTQIESGQDIQAVLVKKYQQAGQKQIKNAQ